MKQDINNAQHFNTDEGNTFVHKDTGVRYGNDLYLSADDTIDNYVEETMTDEEKTAIEDAKKVQDESKNGQAKTSHKGRKRA